MKQLLLVITGIAVLLSVLINTGCAVIVPPSGGPRDSLPPRLVLENPRDFTLNFKGNRLVFTFDEYLEVKDIHSNLIVSPFPKSEPIVESKLRTVTVRLKDTLQPNTTYSLNFGKAIRDINEGNILKNFTYVFSTGSYVDSMQYSGRVLLAETGKADSTLIVMLHRSTDDSAVAKERPRYITRLDSSGYFTFTYLAGGTYTLYALKDESGTGKYTSASQLFAFAPDPIVVGAPHEAITLYAYSDTTGQIRKKSGTSAKAPVKPKTSEKDKRLPIQTNLNAGLADLLYNFEIKFQAPLKVFDSSKINLTDATFNPVPNVHFVQDSNRTKITLAYRWPPDTRFHIIAEKDFAEDTLGRKLLKIDTISFQTKKESDYGSLRLRFKNLDLHRNPVLLFVQRGTIQKSFVFTAGPIFFAKIFQPGEYDLRILYDDNKNGIWDPGQFYGRHRQPEIVQAIRIPKGKPLNVKANYDNEIDIVL